MHITTGNITLDLESPKVMAIINVTPDSFYAASRAMETEDIERRSDKVVEQGASIIDIGGYSSRPGADDVPEEEEFSRVDKAMKIIKKRHPYVMVSIDTFRSGVAEKCAKEYGPFVINDISAGEADPRIINVAREYDLPFIAMHMRGVPSTMDQFTHYTNITREVVEYFADKLNHFEQAGLRQVIVDPGFGFAKTIEQNYELLGELHKLVELDRPVLAGGSRKRLIYIPLEVTPENSLNGMAAFHWECLRQGADILRVHDVKEAIEITKLFGIFRKSLAPASVV